MKRQERKAIQVRELGGGDMALNPARKSRWLRRIEDTKLTSTKNPITENLLACSHRLWLVGSLPQVGDLVLCKICRWEQRCIDARESRERKKKRDAKRLKWVSARFQIDRELLKELRWIAQRDRVTFNSLIVEGLYKARDASYIPDDVLEDLEKTKALVKPPETGGMIQ